MFDDEGYCFVVSGGPSINLKKARLYSAESETSHCVALDCRGERLFVPNNSAKMIMKYCA